MGLNRTPQTRYANDTRRSLETARIQLDFIKENHLHLIGAGVSGRKLWKAMQEIGSDFEATGTLTPNQLSYIDGVYEKVWTLNGFGGDTLHHDMKRRVN